MKTSAVVEWSYGIEPGAAQRMNPENRIWKEVAPTIREHMGDNQVAVAYGIDLYNQSMTGGVSKTLNSISSDCDHVPCVLVVENHPADSRVTIREDGICQALTSRMGTGGGNVPLVLTYDQNICRKEIL